MHLHYIHFNLFNFIIDRNRNIRRRSQNHRTARKNQNEKRHVLGPDHRERRKSKKVPPPLPHHQRIEVITKGIDIKF